MRSKVTAVEFDLTFLRLMRNEILQEEAGAKLSKLTAMTLLKDWRRDKKKGKSIPVTGCRGSHIL
jgi:hypothetical protein